MSATREAVADEELAVALLQLRLELVEGGDDRLARPLGVRRRCSRPSGCWCRRGRRHRPPASPCPAGRAPIRRRPRRTARAPGSARRREAAGRAGRGSRRTSPPARSPGRAPRRRSGRAAAPGSVGLQGGDDLGRVADVRPVQLQHRQGRLRPPRQDQGDRDVAARQGRAAGVVDPLVLERPANLLAVVRDVDLPEGRLLLRLRRSSSACQHKRVALLSDAEIEERLAGLSGWERNGDAIEKSFERERLRRQRPLRRRLVEPAEEMNHHPDVAISWDDRHGDDLHPLRGRR